VDLAYIALTVALFALTMLLVKACERIVGRTELRAVEPLTTDEPAEVAA
jgi:small neutral amino acid transporter SnatA (MarC family)